MRVVFLGNHDVGLRSLRALMDEVEVAGVVAHPPDPEEGVRYASVHDHARSSSIEVVRGSPRSRTVREALARWQPDLLWTCDYRYLLPPEVFAAPPKGAVNLHPSLLPRHRGRAVLNWAILLGDEELGLTAHRIDAGCDTGPVLLQERFALSADEDVGDALRRLDGLYDTVTRRVVRGLSEGSLAGAAQPRAGALLHPRRRAEDGWLSWTHPARQLRDRVRAVARPYPGAFTWCEGSKLTIWKAECGPAPARGTAPGQVIDCGADGRLLVACGEGSLRLLEIGLESRAPFPRVGQRLGQRLG